VAAIEAMRPDMVLAPHVETSSGIILPDNYLRELGRAAQRAGALFVLDCIASGALWVDMRELCFDILVSAPQKGWSSASGFGIVMLGERARSAIDSTTSTSFADDLRKWLAIMEAYEQGGHAYHATMPTDAVAQLAQAMKDTEAFGFDKAQRAQQELGERVRRVVVDHGMPSVAAPGFQAPTVVVSYTDDPGIESGAKF